MALSIGIRNSISFLSAIQATRPLTITLVGLSPTEHTSFSWTRSRTVSFPQYGFKAGISDSAFPSTTWYSRRLVCLRPSCTSLSVRRILDLSRGVQCAGAPPFKRPSPLYPRGPRSSRVMLSRPSTLNWPHAPHSLAHPDFADTVYTRCPRCAPRLLRLGDQRVVPCFHRLFLVDMSPSETPESPSVASTQFLHR